MSNVKLVHKILALATQIQGSVSILFVFIIFVMFFELKPKTFSFLFILVFNQNWFEWFIFVFKITQKNGFYFVSNIKYICVCMCIKRSLLKGYFNNSKKGFMFVKGNFAKKLVKMIYAKNYNIDWIK